MIREFFRVARVGVFVALLAFAGPVQAFTLYLSIGENNRTLGGLTFNDGDLVSYDDQADVAVLLLSESDFSGGGVDIDAVHVLSDGRIALSIDQNNRTLGGLTFNDGDIALYAPATGLATLLLSETAVFSNGNTDIDAFHILDNGNFLLSVRENDRVIGGLTFSDGDIVEYNPVTDVATVRLAESAWGQNVQVDGVSYRSGALFITVADNGTRTLGGATISDGDIVRYDEASGVGSVFFSGSLITGGGVDIDAISAPEPNTFVLLGLGLAGLVSAGRPRRVQRSQSDLIQAA